MAPGFFLSTMFLFIMIQLFTKAYEKPIKPRGFYAQLITVLLIMIFLWFDLPFEQSLLHKIAETLVLAILIIIICRRFAIPGRRIK